MSAHDRLMGLIEAHPSTVREGVDSLALLYQWKRDGGDGPGFMAAVQALHTQGWIEVLPGADLRVRLTAEGFSYLDVSLPPLPEAASADAAEADADESAWRGGAAAARPTPVDDLARSLLGVFALLAVQVGHAVSADTLSRIWAMEGKRGGDLRTALDALAARGALTIHRGERTVFVLTDAGAAMINEQTMGPQ